MRFQLEGQEIPLPHGIKAIVREWDPSALSRLIAVFLVAAVVVWLLRRYFKNRKSMRSSAEKVPVDWRREMSRLTSQGASQWNPLRCEEFYRALRHSVNSLPEGPRMIGSTLLRSEQAVFGAVFWDFGRAQEDQRQVFAALDSAQLGADPLQLYPSEVAQKRVTPNQATIKSELISGP